MVEQSLSWSVCNEHVVESGAEGDPIRWTLSERASLGATLDQRPSPQWLTQAFRVWFRWWDRVAGCAGSVFALLPPILLLNGLASLLLTFTATLTGYQSRFRRIALYHVRRQRLGTTVIEANNPKWRGFSGPWACQVVPHPLYPSEASVPTEYRIVSKLSLMLVERGRAECFHNVVDLVDPSSRLFGGFSWSSQEARKSVPSSCMSCRAAGMLSIPGTYVCIVHTCTYICTHVMWPAKTKRADSWTTIFLMCRGESVRVSYIPGLWSLA